MVKLNNKLAVDFFVTLIRMINEIAAKLFWVSEPFNLSGGYQP